MESLKNLFKDIPNVVWKGSPQIEIHSITAYSKSVAPGALFIAKRGKTGDGHRFIAEAVASGAVAVLTDVADPFLGVTQIIHPAVEELEPLLAKRFYRDPLQKLTLFGITGTAGKTTTSYLLQHFLQQRGSSCGLIGTVAWMTGKKQLPATHTTPDLLTLMHLFYEMRENGCRSAVMEVSSHALDQGRVKDIHFKVAVFTNLTHEHLDYHASMEEYASAKAKLFAASSLAVVNGDDPYAVRMVSSQRLTYGMKSHFDLFATDLRASPLGMEFQVHWKGERALFQTDLIGKFNVENILAATAVALTENLSLHEIGQALKSFQGVPGRLERVRNPKNLQIFVDYSHKPEALKKVLQTLSLIKQGRIITVFGCGGNRDAFKRPQMGAIAEEFSDLSIVTNDNPRGEDPIEIARQVMGGFQDKNRYRVELDRRKAIFQAIEMATPQDIVLIAGKGHEAYQIFAHQTIPFDDVQIAREALIC